MHVRDSGTDTDQYSQQVRRFGGAKTTDAPNIGTQCMQLEYDAA